MLTSLLNSRAKNLAKKKQTSAKSPTQASSPLPEEDLPIASILDPILMQDWAQFNLNPSLLHGLQDLKFTTPTQIQAKTIPVVMSGHDVVGAAQTGSGKTLAFGLPILHDIMQRTTIAGCGALIIVPTRELAIQVSDHLKKVSKHGRVKIVSIVGGLSHEKQRRQLGANPDVIVATPGRLWDLCGEDAEVVDMIKRVRYLVLDEADRMLEAGHFRDLENILGVLQGDDEDEEGVKRSTMLFSATLIPDARKLIDNGRKKKEKKKKKKVVGGVNIVSENGETMTTIADLVCRIRFSDPNPVYINLVTSDTLTAKGIFESRIDCLVKDKDMYLYYILIRYPGKTLVFVNSIDSIRRIVPLLELLGLNVWGIHADMQQRQRLKNLDRFTACVNGILVSSDVSARGLDVPMVSHVVHYQLPRTADLYVHRSGRTARGNEEGVVVSLCGPGEVKVLRRICHALERAEEMPEFPVDFSLIGELKERIAIAKAIDEHDHKLQKMCHELSWLKKTAEDAELSFDEDIEDEELSGSSNLKVREKIKSLKYQLKTKLAQPLIPVGVSRKYITSGQGSSNVSLPEIMMKSKDNSLPATLGSRAIEDLKERVLRKIH